MSKERVNPATAIYNALKKKERQPIMSIHCQAFGSHQDRYIIYLKNGFMHGDDDYFIAYSLKDIKTCLKEVKVNE